MDIKQIVFSNTITEDLKLKLLFGNDYRQDFLNSSNVRRIKWNDETLQVIAQFWDGQTYTYYGVSRRDFFRVINGDAKATTEGSNRRGSWWVGKPSVGAGVHQILNRYPYRKGGQI
jgi:hypothetical protein